MNAKEYDVMIFIGAGEGSAVYQYFNLGTPGIGGPGVCGFIEVAVLKGGFSQKKLESHVQKGLTILGSLCSFFYVCFRKDPDLKNTIVVLE